MATKPKTRKASPKKSDAEKQKEQSERFVKAAREAGVDETGREFERALRKLAVPKRTIKS
jgi:hypothetical protein